jgi:GTP cyclohydrolase I
MKPTDNILRDMPDIANELQAQVAGSIDWVGMNEIEVPVCIENDSGQLIQSTAIVTAYVNLVNPDVRGI